MVEALTWIAKAAKEMQTTVGDAVSSSRIRYAVPSLNDVPPSVQKKVFDADAIAPGIPAMRIDVIPITP